MNPVKTNTDQHGIAKLSRLQRRVHRTWQIVGLIAATLAGAGVGGLGGLFSRTTADPSLALLSIDRIHVASQKAPAVDTEQQPQQLTLMPSEEQHDPATFSGRDIKFLGEVEMTVTAYSPDERSCGPWNDGFTASGYSIWTNGMRLVAADTRLMPFGTILTIPGYNEGQPVQVLDRGGAIKGNRLDVLFATHEAARQWGVRKIRVGVWGYEDATQ